MKKLLVSCFAVGAMALTCAAAGADMRQLIVIPSGQTAVTNAVFASIPVPGAYLGATPGAATAQVIGYMANSSSNITITLSMAGSYTNTMLLATSTGGATTTAAAIVGTPVVGANDNIIVSLAGANTNSATAYVYLSYIKH